MNWFRGAKGATLFLFAIVPLSASSTVLFDQEPITPDGYKSDAIGSSGSLGSPLAVAENFSLSASAVASKISFWGDSSGMNSPDLENFPSWDIEVLNSGLHVVFLTTVSKSDLSPTLTGQVSSFDSNEYKFSFNTSIALDAGDYYIHVGANTVDPDSDGWIWSGANGDSLVKINRFDSQGWVNQGIPSGHPSGVAIEIEGSLVPEPATIFLLSGGLLLLNRRRRLNRDSGSDRSL